jgi:magnesium transporter
VAPVPERWQRPVGHGPGATAAPDQFRGALYHDGARLLTTGSLDETCEAMAAQPDALAWIGLYQPTEATLRDLADRFGLHRLIVEDTIKAHQRAKHERYGDIHFIVLRTARYVDGPDEFTLGEVHIVAGPGFVVTIRHTDNPNLDSVRQRLEEEPELLRFGARAIVYAVLDAIVDRFFPASDGLRADIDDLEDQVFAGGISDLRPAYHLSRETTVLAGILRSTEEVLDSLDGEFGEEHVPAELKSYYADVADHLARLRERADLMQSTLRDVLSMNVSIIGLQRNEEMKKVSAWAAILFTPSLITGIYGMNFVHMPELNWFLGYPMALILMVVSATILFIVFKKKNWI